ncbi:MAG: caspase family protein [Cyanobacteria bacterium P01_A01_bin.84]
MANNWAIAIGINQYQFFQPLRYTQADAETFRQVLIAEAGFLPQQCLLMTDTSIPISNKSTYPTKENILQLIDEGAAQCWQPGDRVWFFFSGYGVNHNRRDYLMPVAGKSRNVEETGIEIRTLMRILRESEVEVLMLLDINRAFGTQADALVGKDTLLAAEEIGCSTILSCQPEEFSHETKDIKNGFFTAIILEGLRSRSIETLGNLDNYLKVRTPELCQDYFRPIQNPISFITSPEETILSRHKYTEEQESSFERNNLEYSYNGGFPEQENEHPFTKLTPPNQGSNITNPDIWRNLDTEDEEEGDFSLSPSPVISPRVNDNSSYFESQNQNATNSQTPKTPLWKHLLLLGVGIFIVGLVGLSIVFLRHRDRYPVNPNSTPVNNSSVDDSTTVKPLPNNQNEPVSNTITDTDKRQQALSDLEKLSLSPTQASDLNKAIALALNPQQGEVTDERGENNIAIWSGMILEIATNRAQKGDYTQAIAAARLIGEDFPNYSQARKSIEDWETKAKLDRRNQTLIEAANKLIKTGQASTYNRAIEVAKTVGENEPGYEEAQKSINKWSQEILAIAKKRAAKGKFEPAIAAANLVPENTNSYNEAQAVIKEWQNK